MSLQVPPSPISANLTPPKSRKRLDGPPYKCDFPECSKVFQRSEHLSRHKLNHNPKKIFRCDYPACGKTFVRNDLLVRHNKRHEARNEKTNTFTKQLSSANSIVQTHKQEQPPTPTATAPDESAPSLISWLFQDENKPLGQYTSEEMFSTDFSELFSNNGQSFFLQEGFEDLSPSTAILSDQTAPLENPRSEYSKNEYQLTDLNMIKFKTLIPSLATHPDFVQFKLEKLLRTYWKFFHARFPILHKPTFVASQTPPMLLLSMFMIGARLSTIFQDFYSPDHIMDPHTFADTIADPLRWHIFSSPNFQPPAAIWIIQSLLLLEFYEKNCSTRKMHERAHLHHGTTIQLLRRLPSLGGSPQKLGQLEDVNNWYNWIEVESLKRATYMCFYMDTSDAINYGHQMLIYAHQLQLTMPVADEVWDANLESFKYIIKQTSRPQRFLIVLKNLLNGVSTKTNSFGKKVLISGLSAVMFQIQQRDLQLAFGLDKFSSNENASNWRELMTAAFSIWRNDVGDSCCSSRMAIENVESSTTSTQFSLSDTRCKCVVYHIAHICMSISQYDFLIYAGAPWRMNVKPSSALEREAICKRVIEWTETKHARVAVVQCYLLLFEMLLSPQDSKTDFQYDYQADSDLFFRSNAVSISVLVLWSYVYIKCGVEDRTKKETGYEYLRRIRQEFTDITKCSLHTSQTNCSGSEYYGSLLKWSAALDLITKKEQMTGLLDMMGERIATTEYSIVNELGKLIKFCSVRSAGSPSSILHDMYD
ncbi:hypothetical protein OGAPHI_001240 [Ogataea philodendri]|uniref:C2H2-type domain-containing protein n=1 Tax=Ogataea philodendri TaxID=1378263 RepID=A0A9P8PFK5_9ASCO|nr:uncharacterized protein OGAPHI_001240 [Ogataea philodendri]KAH3670725.1 hypothetical protein OGAPHI_001240 [Ogataea philodendri]